ncbi:MAG: class I SAM-dependent methyltransferase [Chlamydiae bacterium]|nr:class I SAM-dependent methyltransferase [Chlamydiota bacterium]
MEENSQILDDLYSIDLQAYLQLHGYHLIPPHSHQNEGYMTESQKEQFSGVLATYLDITSVLEIGLNGGHSAEHILRECKGIEKLVSIDLNHHKYTSVAVSYLSQKYKSFEFIEGNSQVIVPEYTSLFPTQKFDLIYIDGDHSYKGCSKDIENCKKLSHPGTRLWIDDYNLIGPNQAILGARIEGIIEVIAFHESSDSFGRRYWAEARYCGH